MQVKHSNRSLAKSLFILQFSVEHSSIASIDQQATRRVHTQGNNQITVKINRPYIMVPAAACNRILERPSPLLVAGQNCFYGRVFRQFDANGDGWISPEELRAWACTIAGQDLTEEDAIALVQAADFDGDGFLGFEEFVRLASAGDLEEGNDEEDEDSDSGLREAFRVYVESEEHVCITPASLQRALCSLGESKWDVDQCRGMICRFDFDGDGVLSFEEFRTMMLAS